MDIETREVECHGMPGYYCNIFEGKWQWEKEEDSQCMIAACIFSGLLGIMISAVTYKRIFNTGFVFDHVTDMFTDAFCVIVISFIIWVCMLNFCNGERGFAP